MTVLRSDIERSLDELISNEEGMRFQGLAVVLARQRWPELIATERKKDLGLDAHAPALLAEDSMGRGLACSLTATLDKVKSDVKKIKQHAQDVKILLFATPRPVTRRTATAWATSIRKAYGVELIVISREDIITDLMLPRNASVCRSHLRLTVPLEPSLAEIVADAQAAAAEVIRRWAAHPRLTGRPRIALSAAKLDSEGAETGELLTLDDLLAMLSEGRRIVLESPAGGGKTTTLVQLAERHHDQSAVALLVDLPMWTASGLGILEYLARLPVFLSRDINVISLAKILQGAVQYSFLLNGWNEVADAYSIQAVQALRELERSFPTAGIIVATRSHRVEPPLPGAVRIALQSLNRQQREAYLNEALNNGADALVAALDADHVLDELTRTPLILAEVATIFQSGRQIPKTKVRVLSRVMQLIEQAEEHRDHLERSPVSGRARDYLAVLAVAMTSQGAVGLEETRARALIHSETTRLNAAGQISGSPEPSDILSTLCAHHVLERVGHLSVAFRFQHQQLQEFHTSLMLQRELWNVVRDGRPEPSHHFALEYVNRPLWDEPLRMAAEEIGELSLEASAAREAVAAGSRLIELALFVDPVFAAELSWLSGPLVWQAVRSIVGDRLRAWYRRSDRNHGQCAVAGMLASGSADFTDILLPLLTSDDQQVRLNTYRAWGEFHLASVGSAWRSVVEQWGEAQRGDFVGEVGQRRWLAEVAEHFARNDPSRRVRNSALQALQWVGANRALSRVLMEVNDQTLDQIVRDDVLYTVPADIRARASGAYRRIVASIDDPIQRINLRLVAAKLGEGDVADDLKRDLESWPSGNKTEREPLVRLALDVVRRVDRDWVSRWVAGRIADGSLWPDRWSAMITNIPEALKDELFAEISTKDLQHNHRRAIAVLAVVADVELVGRAFSVLRSLRVERSSQTEEERQRRAAIARQLDSLIHALTPNLAVDGVMRSLSETPTPVEYRIVINLFGRSNSEDPDLKQHLEEDVRERLRWFIKNGLDAVFRQDDFDGALKADTALALARVGTPDDMPDLERLIRADTLRIERGMAERLRGDRGEAANGATTRWSNWYVRALVWLDPARGEDVLLRLLPHREYEADAAFELVRLAIAQTAEVGFGRRMVDYAAVWRLRGGEAATGFEEDRRRRYTDVLKARIAALMSDGSQSKTPGAVNARLKSLANRVALLDGRASTKLVMDILALPGEWNGWAIADTIEALLRSGARLDAEPTLKVLNPTIDDVRTRVFYDQQAGYHLARCLSLLPFIDPCEVGIARIREVLTATQIAPYELKDPIRALGHSRCSAALGLLRDISNAAGGGFESIAAEWIDAVAEIDSAESRQVLLSFVDPDLPQTGLEAHLEHYHRERLAEGIVRIAQSNAGVTARLYSLCARQLPQGMRLLLADVVGRLGTTEAIIAGLELIHDNQAPAVPYELFRGIENVFLNQRPYPESRNVYTLEPRAASEIKGRLFAMVMNDTDRRGSAWALLGQTESWRLEYGRPDTEPRHPAFESGTPWPPIEAANR